MQEDGLILENVLSVVWLESNKMKVFIPNSSIYINIAVSRLMYRQQQGNMNRMTKVRTIVSCFENVKERTLHTYVGKGFDSKVICSAKVLAFFNKNVKKISEEPLILVLKDRATGEVHGQVETTLSKLNSITVKSSDDKKPLDIKKIVTNREELLEKAALPVEMTIETIEDIGKRVCEVFATGAVSIIGACEKCGVDYFQWSNWLQKSTYLQGIHQQAMSIALTLNQSRHLSMLDNQISKLLDRGYYEEETFSFKAVIVAGQIEPTYTPVGKTIKRRDLSLGEMRELKRMLIDTMIGGLQSKDEFASMTDEELVHYINKSSNQKFNILGDESGVENIPQE
ncbi:MAG: hypothetical protein EKK63_01710 [Acinetobacter sp.]|uniref:hypothetical protein n=1 Tax=Acinetobacter sp. TaxID=472 RepID=UPI000FAA45C1|nr:hypothetical protein [Acinetobacter sp.]RUP42321.1 MAG: hypothetical protein EKK63_01710 [Acinetobacter sp.]